MPAGVTAGSRITHSVIGHRKCRGAFSSSSHSGRRTGSGQCAAGAEGTTPASARRAARAAFGGAVSPSGRAFSRAKKPVLRSFRRSSFAFATPSGVNVGFGVPIPTSATSAFAVCAPTATTRGVPSSDSYAARSTLLAVGDEPRPSTRAASA